MSELYLFHGGAPGLEDGGAILPPDITGIASATLQATLESGLTEIAQRSDRVYMTSDIKLARAYAAMWTDPVTGAQRGGGSVYQVEVVDGSLEPDEDLLSLAGLSYQAKTAMILRVWHRSVPLNAKHVQKKMRAVMREHERAKNVR
ncbi:hypothetical protein [Arthrobacter sp. YD2]|uniref:hypothetical protein n=1 Tax=Arthrobacter sp. YD2 TaxID=3058046 RepID=UPI0025B600C9|nr:hypothetical protein [Arthrobacter sp. YD2]MDN3905783.1 hypothetical protein [Arthrobacter sp. YD2]